MKPEYTPLGKLTPQTKAYKVRAKVIEKAEPKLSPNKTLYQWLQLEDSEGNHIRGALFEDEIESFTGVLELGREYEIANAPLRSVNEKWKTRELDCQMTFGGQTIIQPLDFEAGPVLPKFIPIASVLLTSSQGERFDIIGVVLYMEQVRQVKTGAGVLMDVREVVIGDNSLYQPLILSLWGSLATKACENLIDWPSVPIIAGFTFMRPTNHKGFSLASSMSTSIITNPEGEMAENLKKWADDNKAHIADLIAKLLAIREPTDERIISSIKDLESRKVTNTLQEERFWLEETILEPNVEKIIASIGCSNCGRHCNVPAGETFICYSCPNKTCTATTRANYTFTITDGTGTLKLTTFGPVCEKLFGMPLTGIYDNTLSGNWAHFDEVATKLKTTNAYFKVGPAHMPRKVGALRWALKFLSME